MQYQEVILVIILLLNSQETEESGYNCSDFHDRYGYSLKECQPAKFMLKNHLTECYDPYSKTHGVDSKQIKLSKSLDEMVNKHNGWINVTRYVFLN